MTEQTNIVGYYQVKIFPNNNEQNKWVFILFLFAELGSAKKPQQVLFPRDCQNRGEQASIFIAFYIVAIFIISMLMNFTYWWL